MVGRREGKCGLVRRVLMSVVIVVFVVLLFRAGARAIRTRQMEAQLARGNEVTLTKADGTGSASSGLELTMLGKTAPGFTMVDLTGKKVSLADYKGHPVVVNFWATYCGPCKLEMPWFQEMVSKYQADGLVVLGLDAEDGVSQDDVAKAARKAGVTYPILLADSKVQKVYQLGDYLPETFYVSKNGKVVQQTMGVDSKDEIEADIKKTIAAGGE